MYMNEGYSRSRAERAAKEWVAVPGTSEHQLGIATAIFPIFQSKKGSSLLTSILPATNNIQNIAAIFILLRLVFIFKSLLFGIFYTLILLDHFLTANGIHTMPITTGTIIIRYGSRFAGDV